MASLALAIIWMVSGALYEDPAADRLIREAVESSYALHLSQARAAARALQTRFPDHPAGFTIMAETYWWEAQTDPGNEGIERAYYSAQDLAVDKAEAALKADFPKGAPLKSCRRRNARPFHLLAWN